LTAALTLAKYGISVSLLEAAEELEEVGAGIQLSPNASRVLCGLGFREALAPLAVAPEELRVMSARSGEALARAPLAAAEDRWRAPYGAIPRGDLECFSRGAVEAPPAIALKLGVRVDDFAAHENGITVAAVRAGQSMEETGVALIAADGLWSTLRARLGV